MFHRVHTYHRVTGDDGVSYLPRAYGEPNTDGSWNGYLAFFSSGGVVVATDLQTTEPTLSTLKDWATELMPEDLWIALGRAQALKLQTDVEAEIGRLKFLEREAELEADAFDAEAERDRDAAANARAEAERLRRKRIAYEADS